MNDKTGLVSLGTLVAIALLLPTQARANDLASLETTDGQPAALTSVEPLPKVLTDVVLEAGSEAVVPGAIVADSIQQPQTLDSTVAEAVNTGVDDSVDASVDINTDANVVSSTDTNVDTNVVNTVNSTVDDNDNAQTDALLLLSLSTSSRDLQPIEAPSAQESGLQAPLAQPFDMAQTTSESSPSNDWHFLLVPYVYIPFNISGSVTFNGTEEFRESFSRDFDTSRDFEFGADEITTSLRNSLNFAFLGGLEAWTPNGVVA